ncbi:MAG: hypothetical protein HY749_05495 [Gammaproteobacteria bacterium]|nr:hypothetical protein [Gammaproteobacteria bacterium]
MSRGTNKDFAWLQAWTRVFATLALILCALVLPRTAPALSVQMSSFDHEQTVFPLRDAHRLLECENCHQRATFKGLSPECRSCHRLGQIAATYRRNDHMPTSDQCQQCHSTKDWTTVIRTDHKEVTAARCEACHDGTLAPGKPTVHPDTGEDCGTCHTTAEFVSGIFNHTGVTTDCVRCHNNANATGKDPGHMPTNDRCEDCHDPGSWWNAHLDHADITPGTSCATCHNGTRANGKSPTHIVTSEDCGACHSTTTWNSAVFNHTGVTSDCATCHDGTHAQGKGGQHLSTSNTCETCHTPLGWSPATKVDHSQVNGVCSSCHDGATHDGVVVTGRPATIADGTPHPAAGECSGCHVPGDPTWKANPHTPGNLANGCYSCHNGTSAVTKGPAHLGTSTLCESCHATTAWSPRTAMDHTQVTQLTPCIACHDGAVHDAITVVGKGQTHLPTFAGCDSCHGTAAWTPVTTFAHTGITTGCIDCHTGTFPPALGKNPATHIASSTRCQMCHQGTTAWTPLLAAQVDHTQVTGNCTSCHGSALTLDTLTTEVKPLGHLSTTSECSVCHSTTAWKPASGFDHQGISTGCSAAGCHVDGRTSSPLGRGANHFATNATCEDCHSMGVSFTPHTTVKHANFTAPTPCKTCHDGGTHDGITVTGKTQNHIPTTADCGGCHVGAETSLSFVGGTFDHTGTTSGCASCHDKVHEQGMSPTHIATTADCVTCHATAAALLSWTGGTFDHAGTSTGCVTCHDGSHAPADGKGPSHVASTNSCELCHTDSAVTQLWTSTPTSGHMDHGQLTSVTPCAKCHATTAGSSLTIDGMTVTGRPTNTASGEPHPATGDCNACHSTTGWTGVTFAHSGVTSGCSASGCHVDRNTSPPLGRAASHIATNTNCQDCHSIGGTFTPHTTVNHADITNVSPCKNCHDGLVHDGVTVTGKTPTHIPTGADCATCHAGAETSLSWVGGVFDHTGTTSGCSTCHDGTHVAGTGPLHIGTTTVCEACHTNSAATLSWTSTPTAGNVDHNHITNTVPCTACHANAAGASLAIDGMVITGRPVTTIGGTPHPATGDCGGCHNRSNWQGASFDHTGVTSGCAASGCHTDGRTSSPLGRAASHIATNTNCQDCHYVGVSFTPHTTVKHADITAPTPCAACHDGAVHDGITITGKSSPHIPTNVPTATDCGTCHVGAQNSLNWAGGVYHSKVTVTSGCTTCHDGSLIAAGADAKGANHIDSSSNCETCHGTSVWSPTTTIDHTQVTGTCVSCHDNASHDGHLIGGKGPEHIGSSNACDVCHTDSASTLSWTSSPAAGNVPHAQITNTTPCTACHATGAASSVVDGMTVQGRPATVAGGGPHPTTGDCQLCHSTSNWASVNFDHAGVTSGCANSGCHVDGRTSSPLGRSANHFVTNTKCEDCHYTGNAFTPRMAVKHADFTSLTPCSACHDGGTHDGIVVTGKSQDHVPTVADCAGCHVGAETTLSWVGGTFDHSGTTNGCSNCHDNTHHAGRGPNHIGTSALCEACHTDSASTLDWTSTPTAGNVPHAQISNTVPCTGCHASGALSSTVDGMTVQGRPALKADNSQHPTTGDCAGCHNTTNWTSVVFDHSGVANNCSQSGCHEDGRAAAPLGRSANHFATNMNCQDCHNIGGSFTPHTTVVHADFTTLTPCATCHDGAVHDGVTVTGKSTPHIPTTVPSATDCTTCHTGSQNTLSWSGGQYHSKVTVTSGCTTCHDGTLTATGAQPKSAHHVATSNSCEKCHGTANWLPLSGIDHAEVTGTCVSCHDGAAHESLTISGKGPQHIGSSNTCDGCHTDSAATLLWTSTPTAGNVPHALIAPVTPCTTCHSSSAASSVVDGMTVQGRPALKADHAPHPASGDCVLCHSTNSWLGAAFSHTGVTNGCADAGCHVDGNAAAPLGRSANHFATNTNCQDCHNVGGTFTPRKTVVHADFTTLTPCAACHDGGTHDGIVVTGTSPGHIVTNIPTATDCGTCHVGAQNTLSWAGGQYHSKVTVTSGCASCHADGSASSPLGRSANHFATNTNCQDCHAANGTSFTPHTTVKHSDFTTLKPCASCHDGAVHDGVTVSGTNPGHIATNLPIPTDCATCHVGAETSLSWANGRYHEKVEIGTNCTSCHSDGHATSPLGRSAQHFATNTSCQDCHTSGGAFSPRKTVVHADFTTLTPCASCHDGATHDGITVTGKSTPHIPTNLPSATDCATCHTGAQNTLSWTGGLYHSKVTVTSGCTSCHDGTQTAAGAQAKGTNHVASSNSCEKCHGTAAWSPLSGIDHTQVTGTCVSCHDNAAHDGLTIGGKGPQHIGTSNLCEICHTDSASSLLWTSTPTAGNMPHAQITSTTPCTTCHATGAPSSVVDGMTVQGRPALDGHGNAHVATGDCVNCHNTSNWTSASFNHTGVSSGCTAVGCHTDGRATAPLGRSANHFATNTNCQDCHNVGGSFTPRKTVVHADFTTLTPCASCHDGSTHDGIVVTGTNVGHIATNVPAATDCATCHVGAQNTLSFVGGQYHSKVTVTTGCTSCHTDGRTSSPLGRSANHFATNTKCEDCHYVGNTFTPHTTVKHADFTTLTPCKTCHDGAVHDGVTVTGKTTNHIATTADCAGCHVGAETTLNWAGGTFDHTGTSTGCATCHDGTHAGGTGPQHIGTTTLCEACHTNSATTKLWTSTPTTGNVPHGQITSTTPCTTCHATATGTSFTIDGMTITGRPLKEADGSTHPTTGDCVNCHGTTSWQGAVFNHSGVTSGCSASGCHTDGNVSSPLGRSANHFATNTNCQDCHNVGSAFTPRKTMKHADLTALTPCASCHDGAVHDGVTVTGTSAFPGHIPTNIPTPTDCGTCHTGAETSLSFAGGQYHSKVAVSTNCTNCHSDGRTSSPLGRAATHIGTNSQCQDCHTTSAWAPAKSPIQHGDITTLVPCLACHDNAAHDGNTIAGKGPNHIASSSLCQNCHNTNVWSPHTTIDHTQVTGTCVSCHDNASHDGITIGGKGAQHIGSSNTCDGCHTDSSATLSWESTPTAGNVNHLLITSTSPCTTCHATAAGTSLTVDGMVVTGRPVKKADNTAHPAASDCVGCHSTTAWTPATGFDHTGVNSGCTAAGCHVDGNASSPMGRGANHIATNTNCQDCHNTGAAWTPRKTMVHADLTALTPCASCHDGATHDGIVILGKNGGHIATNIPSATDCGTCHVGAQNTLSFAGGAYHANVTVTSQCTSCHTDGRTSSPIGRAATHIGTNTRCQDCHTTTAWTPAKATINHADITALTPCLACHDNASHDGNVITGKSGQHIATTSLCQNCHNTSVWRPATSVDHTQVSGTCVSCHDNASHDGQTIAGKSAQHIGTSNACDACHTNSASALSWTSTPTAGNVNHAYITATTPCTACHATNQPSRTIESMTVQGRPALKANGTQHPVTGDCGACHSMTAWVPAVTFDHSGIVNNCSQSGCHIDGNTSPPSGRGAQHIPTNANCQDCHAIGTTFTPHTTVKHSDITTLTPCASCHNGTVRDGITISGLSNGHIPVNVPSATDCTTCHVGSQNTLSWAPGVYHTHVTATAGCLTCHSGTYTSQGAEAKNVGHITSSNNCEKCHSTSVFKPVVKVDHNELTLGSGCYGCHNNTTAQGKGPQHIKTSNTCESCHKTSASTQLWVPVNASDVDHTQITTLTPCSSCHDGAVHDGMTIEGKDVQHLNTSNICENCHTGNAVAPGWAIPSPAGVKHTDVIGTCFTCHKDNGTNHTGLGTVIEGRNTAAHIATNTVCEDCHSTSAWRPYTQVNHADVTGTCTSCHNGAVHDGITVQGRPNDAVHNNANTQAKQCDDCHTTTTWVTTVFDHTGITTGCASCHATALATNKPSDKVHLALKATAPCETCHKTTLAWTVTAVDHTQFTTTTPCANCHDGATATHKPSDTIHNQTTSDCVNCHATTSWVVTFFDHTGITGACSGCHNGTTATGKTQATHFITVRECNYCHSTSAWSVPITGFAHQAANFTVMKLNTHRAYSSFSCKTCHVGNAETTAYVTPAYSGKCAGCHAVRSTYVPSSDEVWKASSHSSDVPNDLASHADCAGVCHPKSATATKSGEHRVSSSSF